MKAQLAVKRIFDMVSAAAGLALLGPAMLTITALILWRCGKPALFRQERPGLHGRPFILCKFRTMREAVDKQGNPLPDAERFTPLGNWLRRFSLDELPQLWNVLKGDMSLVGPRPLLMEYLPLYSPEQARRHLARPGITGLAQINGRNAIPWDEKLRLDVRYVDEFSLWLDLKILCRTVTRVVGGGDINQAEGVTMEKFQGSGKNLMETEP